MLNKYCLFILFVLFFCSCKKINVDDQKSQITLIPKLEKSAISIHCDSIVFYYKKISNNTVNVNNVSYFNNGLTQSSNYNLINEDTIIYIQSTDDGLKVEYLNFDKNVFTNIVFKQPKLYLTGGGFKYIGKKVYTNKFHQSDTLSVFWGHDFGFSDNLYYYFDKDIRLRKITSENGKVIYIDSSIN